MDSSGASAEGAHADTSVTITTSARPRWLRYGMVSSPLDSFGLRLLRARTPNRRRQPVAAHRADSTSDDYRDARRGPGLARRRQ